MGRVWGVFVCLQLYYIIVGNVLADDQVRFHRHGFRRFVVYRFVGLSRERQLTICLAVHIPLSCITLVAWLYVELVDPAEEVRGAFS